MRYGQGGGVTCRENGAGERTKPNAHEKKNCLAAVEREPLEEGEGGLAAEWAWDEGGRRGARAQRPQAAPPPQQQRRCQRRTRHAQREKQPDLLIASTEEALIFLVRPFFFE